MQTTKPTEKDKIIDESFFSTEAYSKKSRRYGLYLSPDKREIAFLSKKIVPEINRWRIARDEELEEYFRRTFSI